MGGGRWARGGYGPASSAPGPGLIPPDSRLLGTKSTHFTMLPSDKHVTAGRSGVWSSGGVSGRESHRANEAGPRIYLL